MHKTIRHCRFIAVAGLLLALGCSPDIAEQEDAELQNRAMQSKDALLPTTSVWTIFTERHPELAAWATENIPSKEILVFSKILAPELQSTKNPTIANEDFVVWAIQNMMEGVFDWEWFRVMLAGATPDCRELGWQRMIPEVTNNLDYLRWLVAASDPVSTNYETGYSITFENGVYTALERYLNGATENGITLVNLDYSPKLVALMHNHPVGAGNNIAMFSSVDLASFYRTHKMLVRDGGTANAARYTDYVTNYDGTVFAMRVNTYARGFDSYFNNLGYNVLDEVGYSNVKIKIRDIFYSHGFYNNASSDEAEKSILYSIQDLGNGASLFKFDHDESAWGERNFESEDSNWVISEFCNL